MTDTPAPVAQPLSAEDVPIRNALWRLAHDVEPHSTEDQEAWVLHAASLIAEERATLDAARSVPDNAALRALDAEIARRRAPDYQRIEKRPNGTPSERAGAAAARAMQAGELTGLVMARGLFAAAPASPAGLDVERLAVNHDRMVESTERIATLAAPLDRIVSALRAWRDADGRKPRAIADAQEALFVALRDYEEAVDALAGLEEASPE
jgi:hypothetical protein